MNTFQREILTPALLDEAYPLLRSHYAETSYLTQPFNLDSTRYLEQEKMGMLRVFTARDENVLVGYCVFCLDTNPNSKTVTQAIQYGIYINPEKRGFGKQFIEFCEKELKKEGAKYVVHFAKWENGLETLLERCGYDPAETVYVKRVN